MAGFGKSLWTILRQGELQKQNGTSGIETHLIQARQDGFQHAWPFVSAACQSATVSTGGAAVRALTAVRATRYLRIYGTIFGGVA